MENPAATKAYFSLLFTTVLISAPCVKAEAIVVSEIGAMLSPKKAPLTRAPIITRGSAPSPTPTGSISGPMAAILPPDVPVAVEKSAATIKVISGRKAPDTPALTPSHTRLSTSPDTRSSFPMIPASIHAMVITAIIFRDIPKRIASEASDGFLANTMATSIAARHAVQSVLVCTHPVITRASITPSSVRSGKKAPNIPILNSRRFEILSILFLLFIIILEKICMYNFEYLNIDK